jgi:hypothetical protein
MMYENLCREAASTIRSASLPLDDSNIAQHVYSFAEKTLVFGSG